MQTCGKTFTKPATWNKGGETPPARKPTFSDSATPIVDIEFKRGNLNAIKQDGTTDKVPLPKPVKARIMNASGTRLVAEIVEDVTL